MCNFSAISARTSYNSIRWWWSLFLLDQHMMKSVFTRPTKLVRILNVFTDWNNSLRVDTSLHSRHHIPIPSLPVPDCYISFCNKQVNHFTNFNPVIIFCLPLSSMMRNHNKKINLLRWGHYSMLFQKLYFPMNVTYSWIWSMFGMWKPVWNHMGVLCGQIEVFHNKLRK